MQTLIFFHFLHISSCNSKAVLLNCLFLNPFVFILYQHLPPSSNRFLVATPQSPLDGPLAPGRHCSEPPTTHTPLPLTQQACEALHETRTLPTSQSSLSLPVFLIHCPLPYLLTTPLLASCHLLVLCTLSRIFFSSNSTRSSKAQLRSHLLHEIE